MFAILSQQLHHIRQSDSSGLQAAGRSLGNSNQLLLHIRTEVEVACEEYVLVFAAEVSSILPVDLLALVSVSGHHVFAAWTSLEISVVCPRGRHIYLDPRILLALFILTFISL